MKKIPVVIAVAASVLTAFSAFAFFRTRGLSIYLLSTGLGSFLAVAWQFTVLAAVLLWLALAAVVLTRMSKTKRISVKSADTAEAGVPEAAPKKEKKRGKRTGSIAGSDALSKAGPADKTGKIPVKKGRETDIAGQNAPAAPIFPENGARTVTMKSMDTGETAIMDGGDTGETALMDGGDTGETVLMDDGDADATVLMGDGGDGAAANTDYRPAPADREEASAAKAIGRIRHRDIYCPKCGTKVTGKNFCPNCGTKVSS